MKCRKDHITRSLHASKGWGLGRGWNHRPRVGFSSKKFLQEGLLIFSPNLHFKSLKVPPVWLFRD